MYNKIVINNLIKVSIKVSLTLIWYICFLAVVEDISNE